MTTSAPYFRPSSPIRAASAAHELIRCTIRDQKTAPGQGLLGGRSGSAHLLFSGDIHRVFHNRLDMTLRNVMAGATVALVKEIRESVHSRDETGATERRHGVGRNSKRFGA